MTVDAGEGSEPLGSASSFRSNTPMTLRRSSSLAISVRGARVPSSGSMVISSTVSTASSSWLLLRELG